jgi:hypothetical protein
MDGSEATMCAWRITHWLCMSLAVLAGCAQVPVVSNPAAAPESEAPVLCVGKAQCDLLWQRAQAWVANNSEYRLQTVTDTVIETQGPMVGRTALAYRVTRIPDKKDGARIYVLASCSNAFGCSPEPSTAVAAFKRFLTN